MMSVSSTEMKFDATNWATANVDPDRQRDRPRLAHPSRAVDEQDQHQRHEEREHRGLPADEAPISW